MGDFNVALVIVAAVVSVLVLLVSVYLLVNYQHPDDANQAYFPKLVIVLGLTVAVLSILMLPADVANRQACRKAVYNGALNFTVRHLSSSVQPFPNSFSGFSSGQPCFNQLPRQCAASTTPANSQTTWTMRATFPEYVVALTTIVGSVLFTIFGGVGIACLPLGLIFSFVRRPKAVITRSQYIKEATELGKKVRELKKAAEALHQEERSGNKGRKWRKNVKALEKELLLLEDDMKALEEMYPQGEQAEATWAFTVLGYIDKLIFGVVGLIVSIAWVEHIVISLLIDPPLSSFLNEVFIKLDGVWGLLGTAAFAFFCFYLLIAVIAGGDDAWFETCFHHNSPDEVTASYLGILFFPAVLLITNQSICFRWGGTLMNSFLFNVGLILLCSISVIQFGATAFAYYAQATAAQEIFGHTLQSLRGIKYLYKYNVFQYGFVALAFLTLFY
ncbi:hypothetical protein SETIT_9G331800v2 [Setaria italica]|uniref:LIMR family protein n=1 Tax=Setaria italica TaxID=4555 RepID=K4AJH4_SETIT|nr:hypothetical protein SETIT_9G331800v2 [Setaria italica]